MRKGEEKKHGEKEGGERRKAGKRGGKGGRERIRKEMRGHGHGFYVQLTLRTITLLNVLHAPW